MATLEQIQAKLKKLQAQAEALIATKSQGALKEIRGLMEKYGLTTADIDAYTGGKKRGPKPTSRHTDAVKPSIAQYQDPKTGATWSGRGRAPGWIANAKDRSAFLLNGSAAKSVPVAATKSKAIGNYVRGPQPPKYQDPKSGATWSGRGRTPAWLAGAKDRNKFLIDGVVPSAEASTVAKKPTTKKVAAKMPKVAATEIVRKKSVAKRGTGEAPVAVKSAAMQETKAAKKSVAAKKTVSRNTPATKDIVKNAPSKKMAIPSPQEAVNSAPGGGSFAVGRVRRNAPVVANEIETDLFATMSLS